jgi:predicted DNA-binding transcriptional regulator AlpA
MEKLYTIRDVCEITTLCRSTILRLIKNHKFPKPHSITGSRRTAWDKREIDIWIQAQVGSQQQSGGFEEDAYANGENNQ